MSKDIIYMKAHILFGRIEQLYHLRLRQPHAVVLHADVQTGLAVGCLINDNLAPVHESKDTNKPKKSITFRSQPIRPSFSNKNISGRDIPYPALRSTTIPYPDPYKRFFLAP